MTRRARSGRTRVLLGAIAMLLVIVGGTALVIGLHAQREAPQPPPGAAGTYAMPSTPPAGSSALSTAPSSTSPDSSPSGPHSQGPQGPVLSAARPTRLRIPAIGVNAPLIKLGLNSDRTIQVPPLSADSKPGWYKYSPSPGQLGPSVILGHVDSAQYGPAVFFKLGALRKGDKVDVTRSDSRIAVFRIDAVAEYPKKDFPTMTVYGSTDHAALRLITCGGSFDSATHNYRDNIVAFASLIGSHHT